MGVDVTDIIISTHAPRTGGDFIRDAVVIAFIAFQPTPPAQGATFNCSGANHKVIISTHAPRTGGDVKKSTCFIEQNDFNPRPPHRGRLFLPGGRREK